MPQDSGRPLDATILDRLAPPRDSRLHVRHSIPKPRRPGWRDDSSAPHNLRRDSRLYARTLEAEAEAARPGDDSRPPCTFRVLSLDAGTLQRVEAADSDTLA